MSAKISALILSSLLSLGFITQWFFLDSRLYAVEIETISRTDTVLELVDKVAETHKLQEETLYEIRRAKLNLQHAVNQLKLYNYNIKKYHPTSL